MRVVLVTSILLLAVCQSMTPERVDTADVQFAELMAKGRSELEAGNLESARATFSQADALILFEVPNYRALVEIAELECRADNKQKARSLLRDFHCMLNIEVGVEQCYAGTATGELGQASRNCSAGVPR